MNSGWLKIHRRILAWEWYTDPNTIRLFLHLLLTANYVTQRWQGKLIQPGQLLTGRNKLAQELSLTVRKIRTSLDKLKKTGEVSIKTIGNYSIITICKWNDYQSKLTDNRPSKRPAESQARDQPSTTIKEGKEIKEEKKYTLDRFNTFWDTYSKKVGREKCVKVWQCLPESEIEKILVHVPQYVLSTPDAQFRKNPLTYLSGKHWNDEIIYPGNKSNQNQSNRNKNGQPKLAI